MKNSNSSFNGLVPIVLGVTGHRDIPSADIDKLEESTCVVLNDISSRCPHSPLVLISCLAEGADRIAARCAIKLGWHLGVVLPAVVDVYEQDFQEQQSKTEYRELLALADWVEVKESGSTLAPDYFGAGFRVMQQSQLLLAYWDGKVIGLKGGTSDIVTRFLSEIQDSGQGLSGNTPPDARPVIHVTTRRAKDLEANKAEHVGFTKWLAPNPGGMGSDGELERWDEILKHIDQFNSDVRASFQYDLANITKSRQYLDDGLLAEAELKYPIKDQSASMFAVADAMSSSAQKERSFIFYWLAGLASIAILMEQIFSGPFPYPLVLGLAVLSGVIAVGVFKLGVKNRVEERYLDYRSLAEACRVQHFWMRSGVRASVADNFLLEQRDELEWVRQAIRTNELGLDVASLKIPDCSDSMNQIRISWIEDQRKYFVGTPKRMGKAELNSLMQLKWSKVASHLFLAGVLSVMALAAAHLLIVNYYPVLGEWLIQYAAVTYGLLFAIAGLIKVYQEVNAFSEHSKSYRRSGMLMQRASYRLRAAIDGGNIEAAQRIIYEAGCEALDENGDWLLLHRDRPVEVPLG